MTPGTIDVIAMLALMAIKEARTVINANSQETDEQLAARVAQNLQRMLAALEVIKQEMGEGGV